MGLGTLTRSRDGGGDGRLKENPAHAHAAETLRRRGIVVKRVIRVDPTCVAFESRDGVLCTAWLLYLEERAQTLVWVESGLPAFPSGCA